MKRQLRLEYLTRACVWGNHPHLNAVLSQLQGIDGLAGLPGKDGPTVSAYSHLSFRAVTVSVKVDKREKGSQNC